MAKKLSSVINRAFEGAVFFIKYGAHLPQLLLRHHNQSVLSLLKNAIIS